MEPLLIITLLPNQVKPLPLMDYSGSLLLRWQILIPTAGIDVLSLTAVIDSQQTIDPIGFLQRGQWGIAAGDRLKAPLTEIAYSPFFDWFVTTPDGFKNSQLLLYPYVLPVYQIPHTGQSMSISIPSPTASSSSPTTVAAAITSGTLAATNAGRVSGLIVNSTNRTLWVNFNASAATTTAPSVAIAAGGNVDIPAGYVGAITGLCAGLAPGLTGTVQITEFNQG